MHTISSVETADARHGSFPHLYVLFMEQEDDEQEGIKQEEITIDSSDDDAMITPQGRHQFSPAADAKTKLKQTKKHKQCWTWEDAIEFADDCGFFDALEPPENILHKEEQKEEQPKDDNKPDTQSWEGCLRHHNLPNKQVVSHLTAAVACLTNNSNVTSACQLNKGLNVNNLQY